MYIDTHCHLNFKEFAEDLPMVMGNAKKAGVKKFIVPGASILTSKSAVELAHLYPTALKAAVGCHPYETNDQPDISSLEKFIDDTVVAIGECGLDYHMYKGFPAIGKKEEQKQLFDQQLHLAIRYNLPVIIHCRDAYEDIFPVLDALPTMPKGVFHCFGGGAMDVTEVQKRGFFIGLDGNITYSKQLALVVPTIPLSMILLETDAPLLPPALHRGERNEPKYIPIIAQKISELTNSSIAEVEEITTRNALNLFRV